MIACHSLIGVAGDTPRARTHPGVRVEAERLSLLSCRSLSALRNVVCGALSTAVFIAGIASARQITLKEVLTVGKRGEFIRVEDAASDSRGNLYVSDSYQFSIRKFTPDGVTAGQFGHRGKDPDGLAAFPYKIGVRGDTLAFAQVGLSTIRLLTTDFRPAGEILAAGPVVAFAFNGTGKLYVSVIPISHRKEDVLVRYSSDGGIDARIPLLRARGEPAMDIVQMAVDGMDRLIVAYRYVNEIAVYSPDCRLILSFSVPGFPAEAPSTKSKYAGLGAIPDSDIIKDVAVDPKGNILVLAGDCGKHPGRDVYVFSPAGKLLTTFLLPDKSGILRVDPGGCLLVREHERTLVRRYRMHFGKTRQG